VNYYTSHLQDGIWQVRHLPAHNLACQLKIIGLLQPRHIIIVIYSIIKQRSLILELLVH